MKADTLRSDTEIACSDGCGWVIGKDSRIAASRVGRSPFLIGVYPDSSGQSWEMFAWFGSWMDASGAVVKSWRYCLREVGAATHYCCDLRLDHNEFSQFFFIPVKGEWHEDDAENDGIDDRVAGLVGRLGYGVWKSLHRAAVRDSAREFLAEAKRITGRQGGYGAVLRRVRIESSAAWRLSAVGLTHGASRDVTRVALNMFGELESNKSAGEGVPCVEDILKVAAFAVL